MEKNQLKSQIDRLIPEFKLPLENLSKMLATEPNNRAIEITDHGIYLVDHANGGRFELRIDDPRTAVSCLLVQGYYEPTETSILTELAKVSKCIIDIGANIGYYAVKLGRVMSTESKLYAIEPLDSAFSQLVNNIQLNDLSSNVYCHQIAFNSDSGKLDLYVPLISGSSASSMRELHPEEFNQIQSVESVTMDTFVSKYMQNGVDLIKIDVEGAELLVLESGWKTISKFKPIIFAELLRKWSAEFGYKPETLKRKIEGEGYSCFEILQDNKISFIAEIDEKTIGTNFLFLPEEKSHYLDSILKKFILKA
jgi:FkbM family methyltransferase